MLLPVRRTLKSAWCWRPSVIEHLNNVVLVHDHADAVRMDCDIEGPRCRIPFCNDLK